VNAIYKQYKSATYRVNAVDIATNKAEVVVIVNTGNQLTTEEKIDKTGLLTGKPILP